MSDYKGVEHIHIHDYGLLLSEGDVKTIAKQVDPDYDIDKAFNEDKYFVAEIVETIIPFVEAVDGFYGAIYPLDSDGIGANAVMYENSTMRWEYLKDEVLFYIPLASPTLFKAHYKSVRDVVKELKNTVGSYLGEDYPYKQHLYVFEGTQHHKVGKMKPESRVCGVCGYVKPGLEDSSCETGWICYECYHKVWDGSEV